MHDPAPVLPESVRPIHAIRALRRHGPVVALESALAAGSLGTRHLVAGRPRFLATFQDGCWQMQEVAGRAPPRLPEGLARQPFAGLRALLDRFAADHTGARHPWGAFGYFGYECTAEPGRPRLPVPDAWFLFPEVILEWSPSEGPARWWSGASGLPATLVEELAAAAGEPGLPYAQAPETFDSTGPGDLSLQGFRPAFAAIREELRQGNSYQVCFTHALERRFDADPLDLYRVLCRDNPAPFAAYLEAPDFCLVSSSPERFLKVDAGGWVEARPMKGTAARGRTAVEDQALRLALAGSRKDRAENLMIADLLRNDLARVCRLGTVEVASAAEVEEYATVFQMISRVVGRLESDRSTSDLLAAAFPPGSMTGAPKVRSMEILRRLEQGPRGPYSGILGWWSVDDRADFSVLIRQWLVRNGVARAQVGGGVVWESRLEEEFQESCTKARALLQAWATVCSGVEPRSASA